MKGAALNVRIPEGLRERIERIVRQSKDYISVSDFVRQAVREKLQREEGVA